MIQQKHYDELTVMSGIAIIFVLAIHGCGSALKSFYPGGTKPVFGCEPSATSWCLRFRCFCLFPALSMLRTMCTRPTLRFCGSDCPAC